MNDFYEGIRSLHRLYEASQKSKQLNKNNMKIELNFPKDSDKLEMISKAEVNQFIVQRLLDGSIREKINVLLHSKESVDVFDRTLTEIAEYIKSVHNGRKI